MGEAEGRQRAAYLDRAVGGWSARPNLQHQWLFAGGDRVPTQLLVDELKRAFILEEKVPLRGQWHQEIQVYVSGPGAAPLREPE